LVTKENAPFCGAGIVGRFFFGRISTPVQHSRLLLDSPSSLSLRYSLQLLPDVEPKRSESDGRIKLVFEHGPMSGLDDPERNLPSDVPAFPTVAFSIGTSWKDVAEAYAKIVDTHINTADVKTLVDKLTQGKSSRERKTQSIL